MVNNSNIIKFLKKEKEKKKTFVNDIVPPFINDFPSLMEIIMSRNVV